MRVVSSTGRCDTLTFEREVECDGKTTKTSLLHRGRESAEIRDRWRKGEGRKSSGRVFGKSSGTIFSYLMHESTGNLLALHQRRDESGATPRPAVECRQRTRCG